MRQCQNLAKHENHNRMNGIDVTSVRLNSCGHVTDCIVIIVHSIGNLDRWAFEPQEDFNMYNEYGNGKEKS